MYIQFFYTNTAFYTLPMILSYQLLNIKCVQLPKTHQKTEVTYATTFQVFHYVLIFHPLNYRKTLPCKLGFVNIESDIQTRNLLHCDTGFNVSFEKIKTFNIAM